LADAANLTTEEHGAYLLLIMTYWQRGKPLSADPERLARVARLSNERWTDVERTLSEFFDVVDGEWRHKRIDAELDKVHRKSEVAREAGRQSGIRRNSTNVQQPLNSRSTDVQRTLNHTDTDTDTKKEREEPARVKILEEKEVVDASTHKETIRELLATRKLTDWEKQFLGSLAATRTLTRFQREKLDAIIGAKEFNTADPPPEPFNGKSNGRIWVKAGTEAFDAWDDWWRKHKGKSAPRDTKGGWYFETEFPQEQAAQCGS
jgi:uncharacterized protein YdaU (DUF1376 family)